MLNRLLAFALAVFPLSSRPRHRPLHPPVMWTFPPSLRVPMTSAPSMA